MNDPQRDAIASTDREVSAKASCDFAQEVWAGRVSDQRVLDLLTDPDPQVRGEVAWAVADGQRPAVAVRWLIEHGLTDPRENVRYWTSFLLCESDDSTILKIAEQLRAIEHDPSQRVARRVQVLLKRCRDLQRDIPGTESAGPPNC
jgi:HEAT repeat protein